MRSATFLTLTSLAAVASFWTSLVARPHTLAVCARAPTASRRCVSPRASASDGEDEHWTAKDDMALYQYIAKRASEFRCGAPDEVMSGAEDAWVLIFNPGKTNEGVYTLQGRALPSVLAFESMSDADRFSRALAAEQFHQPTPMKWRNDQLSQFCSAGQFELSVVPMVRAPNPRHKHTDTYEWWAAWHTFARALHHPCAHARAIPVAMRPLFADGLVACPRLSLLLLAGRRDHSAHGELVRPRRV